MIARTQRQRTKARRLRRKILGEMGLCTHCGLDKPAGEERWKWCTACAIIALNKRKRKIPVVFDRDALHACAIRWQAGDKQGGAELIRRLQPYFNRFTRRFPRGVFGCEDARQELAILALEASKAWEPTGGASLMTFLMRCHWQYAVERLSLDVRYVARLQIGILIRLNRALKHTHIEDAHIVDDDCAKDARLIALRPVCLDSTEGITLLDYGMADDAASAEELLMHHESVAPMIAMCRNKRDFTKREQDIINHRLAAEDPITLDEVGAQWGVTRERVRQVELSTLNKLKTRFGVTVLPAKELTVSQHRERVNRQRVGRSAKRTKVIQSNVAIAA